VRVERQPEVERAPHALEPLAAPDGMQLPGPQLADRLVRRTSIALMAANGAGAVVTFVLSTFVVPAPPEGLTASNQRLNAIAFGVVLALGLVVGFYVSSRVAAPGLDWLREDRDPTPEERDRSLGYPLRQTAIEAVLWVGAAAIFTAVNLSTSTTLALEVGLEVVLGGIVTCCLTYLLAERLSRPATARALEARVPEEPIGPAIGARVLLIWAGSTAVPLVAVGLIGVVALGDVQASRDEIGLAVAVLAALGVLVGLTAMTIYARSMSEPLRGLRSALGHVEAGELDVSVAVDDAGEVGVLQAGFNRMVHGLREREKLRDLFGRHVGEEVARNALEREDVELGGELREAAVLFVDVIGSTRLASTHDPADVVARLNAFFAIVVDCVSLHGGWVNKFEGDAALCVFGAPTPHPDAAGSALATARALRFRFDHELDGIEAAIGVSAGEVVAGNVGAAERFEYTVIGDPVNEAARLTELAKTTPAKLLASDTALALAGRRERDRWQLDRNESLRGRTRPTGIVVPR
jgi:adenylate cyclase